MRLLEERIRQDGVVIGGEILKVDSFINHQLDISFLNELGREFHRLFSNQRPTKILTIEASGIAIAALTAQYFDIPVVFAKKSRSQNISKDVYTARVDSFTHKTTSDIVVSKQYLGPEDRVLIIDDFLAVGNALLGLTSLCEQAGAYVVGCGIVIEKAYQGGGELLRKKYRVESLARISSMSPDGSIEFCR